MAATIPVEVETGIDTGRVHPHNGYYAGDFSTSRTRRRGAQSVSVPGRPAFAATAD